MCVVWPEGFSPEKLKRSGKRVDGCLLLVDKTLDIDPWASQRPVQFIFFDTAPPSMTGALAAGQYGQIELISDGLSLWVNGEK